jgi:hypothetical protein
MLTPSANAYPSPKSPKTLISQSITETGPLNEADLVAIGRLKAKAAADQFSDDPTLPYVGRGFAIVVDPELLTIHYDRDAHSLRVSFGAYFDSLIFVRDTKKSLQPSQNAFGAKAIVSQERGDVYGILLPGDDRTRETLAYVSSLDGPAARELSKAIRLRLTGTIARANYVNTAVLDLPLSTQATIAQPIDIFVDQHLVCVSLSQAEWFDSRSGKTLELQHKFLNREPARPLCKE